MPYTVPSAVTTYYICSAQTGNLRKPRIALCKPGIPGLANKPRIGPGSNADRTGPDGPGCDDCDFGRVTCADHLKPAKIQLPQNLAHDALFNLHELS